MLKTTSASDTPTPVNTSPVTKPVETSAENLQHQEVIDEGTLSVKEQKFLDDIDVDDVFDKVVTGFTVNLAKRGKHLNFAINSTKKDIKKISKANCIYVVKMSSKKMKEAQEQISDEVNLIIPFDKVYSSLSMPEEIKGFDNEKTMKNFIAYMREATTELTDIGDTIKHNINILVNTAETSDSNSKWLYSNRYEWDDRNVAEISSMALIGKDCRDKVIDLESELKDVKNQLAAIKLRTADASDDMVDLVKDYMNGSFDVKIAKRAIITNNTISVMNNKHNNAITKLINEQKEADKVKFNEFTEKIKTLNATHAKEMKDLRDKHDKETDKLRTEFQKKLEDQAASFAKILDDSNKKHKKELADLHVYYKAKIAEIIKGYEKTILDLKDLITDYALRLEKANALISSYYDALDTSNKAQADMLTEFKTIAADRKNDINTSLNDDRLKAKDESNAPVTTESDTLTGSLAVNAAAATLRVKEEKEAAAEKKILDDEAAEAKRTSDNIKIGIGIGAGALAIGAATLLLSKNKGGEKKDNKTDNTKDQ